MPWKATRLVDERTRFIASVLEDPRGNFTRLCARFGISRNKGYKWLARYRAGEPLDDRRPLAATCPHRTPADVEALIVETRKEHPFDGPKKLIGRLQASHPSLPLPAASTVGEILSRRGLVRPRRMRLRMPPHPDPLGGFAEPNDAWCTDFKGHFALGNKARLHPLTIEDGASRYLIKCEGLSAEKETLARPQFERAFREFGLPRRIRSDNGSPFATRSLGGLSQLSVWWIQLGIIPERIEPGCPQQNGRLERFHRTLKEQTASPPADDAEAQQRRFDEFRVDYNHHRPHEALGQTPPASHYEPSLRAMPDRVREPEYEDTFDVRRVSNNGVIKWRSPLFINKLLIGQPVGLRAIEEDIWEIFYGPLKIGRVVMRDSVAKVEALRI